jgi:phage-related protein
MYHSVTFRRVYTTPRNRTVLKNSYTDFKLVPSSRPVIAPPELKTSYVDIPGGNGSIDLSEVVSGCPVYENREGDIEFYVLNSNYPGFNNYDTWIKRYTDIMNFLHGRKIEMILEDDPDYYYRGRFSVDEWASEKDYSMLTLSYILEPFKWASKSSLQTKPNLVNINVGSIEPGITLNLTEDDTGIAPIVPRWITTATMTVTVHNSIGTTVTKTLQPGSTIDDDIKFTGGDTVITLKGSGVVSIDFKEGRL